ncbi:hypothetical protein [Rubrolithibacter danxiaensis]|uniref:hypothetical protein n=1 Tax=Rubrolithibacter danxiaensis TaxID=3390805 RepID=UPI003BF80658
MKRTAYIIFFLTCISHSIFAQHSDPAKFKHQLQVYEDSLRRISYQVINNENEPERYNNNYKFIKTLISALKVPNSFNYDFDSLKTVSILTSSDMRFRIFTWHVLNNDGSYRYYGTIQMNYPDGKLKMFPLVDYTSTIKDPADTVTSNENWYGAQYYKIIPVTYNVKTPYYILLGWKGNSPKTTKKVIEALYFKDDKAVFGMPVFDAGKEKKDNKRVIFEYSRQVSMLLNYLPKEGMIVFDHLAPPDPKMKEKFDMYGPDMSYDGLKLVNGRWKLEEDLRLKNPPNNNDENFNDPKKPANVTKRKLY